jgi:hypothetical protein
MPSIEIQNEFTGISPTDCYNAAENSIEALGFSFIKKRPLGWLLQIKNNTVNANLAFRPGRNTTATFSLSSESETEEALQATAKNIEIAIRENL